VKSKLLFLPIFAILTVLLLAGCEVITGSWAQQPAGSEVSTPGGIDYAALGMTPEEVQQWEERGSANVDTLEAASVLAGYKVLTPAYIPNGFYRQKNIIVTNLGGGLPEGMKPKFSMIIVETIYFLKGNDTVMFDVRQSNGKEGLGGGQPAEICGMQGEKQYLPADPQRKYPGRILVLEIQKNGYSFSIYATLAGPLDEATIEKIFCSVNPD
jgi:hypothetical protein